MTKCKCKCKWVVISVCVAGLRLGCIPHADLRRECRPVHLEVRFPGALVLRCAIHQMMPENEHPTSSTVSTVSRLPVINAQVLMRPPSLSLSLSLSLSPCLFLP